MHHPPVQLGLPALDAIGMRADHADRLREVVLANEQIELVMCGHVHRPATSRIGHAPVFACPSVFYPARPDHAPDRAIALVDGPVGIGVHVRTESGGVASHVRIIGDVPGEQRVIEPPV
jgi:3',5'-cyclic AMP phosphodiesterase CpdA